ncbi:CopD family protein [Devosia epidermidihirudinis]|uniref:CopD family protein n=1 Tax=Devosia epidermidihirudinis TaxID=1293439 RepID=UPI0009E2F8B9|nr:CopD family protein [Devosia epidermidihirudinis]
MIVTWFKFIHVAAITLWAGGLLALPFLYHQRKGLEDEALFKLHAFTRHFYVAIISPAAFVAIGSGTVLIFLMSTYGNWFSAKLLAVAMMTGIHIFSGLVILRLFEPGHTYPAWRQAVVVTLTAIVITVILTLVLGKPRLDWPGPLAEVFAPGALSKIAEQIIDGAK